MMSLVQIAQGVLGSGGPVISTKKSAPLAVSNVPDVDMGSVDSIHDFLVSQMHVQTNSIAFLTFLERPVVHLL